jgi:hypothetical protein
MIDEIFACPIRKYNIDNNRIKSWASGKYDEEKFEQPSPFKKQITAMDGFMMPLYVDIFEQFVKEIGLEKTHLGIVTNIILSGLEKDEYLCKHNTLPSHYTATHFIEGSSPDVYHHPAQTVMNIFAPPIDEWNTSVSLYTNEGDIIIHPSYLEYSTPRVDKRRVTLTFLLNLQEKE